MGKGRCYIYLFCIRIGSHLRVIIGYFIAPYKFHLVYL